MTWVAPSLPYLQRFAVWVIAFNIENVERTDAPQASNKHCCVSKACARNNAGARAAWLTVSCIKGYQFHCREGTTTNCHVQHMPLTFQRERSPRFVPTAASRQGQHKDPEQSSERLIRQSFVITKPCSRRGVLPVWRKIVLCGAKHRHK